MNSQEKKIVVGGVVIAALSSAGFSMAQGDFNHIDDDYKSPYVVSEETVKSKVDEVDVVKSDMIESEEDEYAIGEVENRVEEKNVYNTYDSLKKTPMQTSNTQVNTSTPQTKPLEDKTEEEKPQQPGISTEELEEEKPQQPEISTEEIEEEKPQQPEISTEELEEDKPQQPDIPEELEEEKLQEPDNSTEIQQSNPLEGENLQESEIKLD